jgi:predicted nucleic acid-binding protein
LGVVVDASFLTHALLPSQVTVDASDTLDRLTERAERLAAPTNVTLEFMSAVRQAERRGALQPQRGDVVIARLQALNVEFRWEDRWLPRALEVARAANLSAIYDPIYLACAESYGWPLYTCDRKFEAAMRRAGITAEIRVFE